MSAPFGQLPRWVDYGLLPFINLVVAFLVSGLVVLFIGASPLEAINYMVTGALGSGEGLGFTLYYATSFIFTGLSVAVAFHCGLFNIGGEGQVYVGGLGVALVALALDRIMPWYVTAPLAAAAGFAFGAAWALVPAWLQAKRGSHIVITTIMFNFIAASLMVYLLVNVMKQPGSMSPQTRLFESGALLPRLGFLFSPLGLDLGTAPLNVSFFLALASGFLVWVLVWRTRFGYEIRTIGANPTAAAYAGIRYGRTVVITMLISGGLAGLMALNVLLGDHGKLQIEFPSGAGFVGIAVALMGRSHPVGIVLAAILFGILYQGGAELAFWVPNITREMIVLIQGLVILFAGALEYMFRPALVRLFAPRGAAVLRPA
ncbi:ABC transporter permease [Prosthecomicrobium pneumaticum]|uniref:Simple sugar transport system permease protein n=1 Tax=Prosthecomicrobium pneumaticum TaxID=81895 RepID=A0A7W9L2V5_9HYPH|nr:ABC transporter permease [Prosthecomicrobium pneumaticum]MBB5753892.1 simple sugar transport system permease protein [Prosthecomicrobium pneumaticum]